jgi:hypothetical protein
VDLSAPAARIHGMKTSALIATLLGAAVLASAARADGLPANIEVGPSGVTVPGQSVRFVAFPVGRNTLVQRIELRGGRVASWRVIRGRFTIPAVAYDGSAGGLARNGKTLVLIRSRTTFPRARTTYALVDPATLKLQKTLTFRGDFSFDALAPDGRWMYLIHYTSALDPLKYEVRVFDLVGGRLDPKPIVDPREPGEAMNGDPLTRATSPDGRWAYTLYSGEHPFVHALDTVGRDARCIDLEWLTGRRDLWTLRLALGSNGRDLSIRTRSGERVARVNTRTFQASIPTGSRNWWTWVFVLTGGLLAAAIFAYGASSRRRAAATSFGGATSA